MRRFQAGQTLIETILATFILTTSLVAGLSVAIYVLTAQAVSENQVIATNLAREGIEAVRMMRDTNWLAAEPDPASPDPDATDDLQSCPDLAGDFCYPKAFSAPSFNLAEGNYRLNYNSATRAWSLQSGGSFDLFLQVDGQYTPTVNGTSIYAREISIAYNTASPYTPQNPEVHVKSGALWRGKNCTEFDGSSDLFAVSTPCKVIVEEHLTNWKDYK
ncbi:MAG: hypothetical protein HYV13_03575 [Candidatus Doudnabacteria bacterium]|nr:hypothetical protein [Candidatus Doudnabacteria bacterium]